MVNVVIPVYNRTIYLGTTIKSVLYQTYSDWDLIVVDDGSEEDVEALLKHYPDQRIRLLKQTNQGNAAARNTGIRQARGKHIICLDSDDVWHPDILKSCVAALESYPEVDVVYTQVQQIDADGKLLPGPVGPDPKHGNLLEPLLMGFPILPSSAVVQRRCFERWGMYKPGLDDWELWLRWAARGCRFAYIGEPLLYYRIHAQNFNLDWPKRHKIHFTMLDTFYKLDDLPLVAIQMRDRVYANQHFRFAVLAWQTGRPADGLAEFIRAVKTNPDLLSDLDFYTGIACAHQGRLDAGTTRGLDLVTAQRTIVQSLNALFAETDLPVVVYLKRSVAYGWAYLALARLAYSVPHDMVHARRFLLRSFAAWPVVAWYTDWAAWLARALIGYQTIQRLKKLFYKRPTKVQHARS